MAAAMLGAEVLRLSAGSWIELGAVTSGIDDGVHRRLRMLMTRLSIKIEPVTAEQAQIGHEAYRNFGKGNHAARLNLGDCFPYALSKELGEPLLFKGDDFPQTDIEPALKRP